MAQAPSPPTAPPEPTIVDGKFVPTHDVPFSEALDAMIAEVRAGNAPNLGRFCGYCYTPLDPGREVCPTCGTSADAVPVRDKISRTVAQVYTAKRKREGRYVHGAAWAGILLGTAVSTGLIVILPDWTKVFAILFLIVGSYYLRLLPGQRRDPGLRLPARPAAVLRRLAGFPAPARPGRDRRGGTPGARPLTPRTTVSPTA